MLARQLGDGGRVEVDAVADTGEVVDYDGQRAVGGNVIKKAADDGRSGGLAEIGRGQTEDIVCAGGCCVVDELEDLTGRVSAHASH